jgi:hypothetical protein
MDWAGPSQEFFLKKVEGAALAEGKPLSELERGILCQGSMGFYQNMTPPEPGFRKRVVRLLNQAYESDLKAYEKSTRPWKHFGYPKFLWMRNLRNWHPPPVNALRAAVEHWVMVRFGELRMQEQELFGGM